MSKKRPKTYLVRDPTQLEAVVSPVRHQLLRTLGALGPVTVKELAERMGRSPESLYYHVRALEEVGLLEQVDERRRRGRAEAVYATVARTLVTDPSQTSPAYVEAMQRSAAALLRLADRQLSMAFDRQRRSRSRRPTALMIRQYHARLSAKAQRELVRRLEELAEFVQANDDPHAGEMIALTLALAPLASRDEGS